MRRSKALPSKSVRNYRSVSQRRMTSADDDHEDPDAEMDRLRRILAQSRAALGKDEDQSSTKLRKESNNIQNDGSQSENPYQGILSDDLVSNEYGESGMDDLIVTKKKKGNKKRKVELTPEEIRQAKLLEKQTQRKLRQLEERKAQKELRSTLYQKLQKSSISKEQRALLQPSATLGQTLHKKQQLRHLLQKERAGLTLTTDEHALLYQDRKEVSDATPALEQQISLEHTPSLLLDGTKDVNSGKNKKSIKQAKTEQPAKKQKVMPGAKCKDTHVEKSKDAGGNEESSNDEDINVDMKVESGNAAMDDDSVSNSHERKEPLGEVNQEEDHDSSDSESSTSNAERDNAKEDQKPPLSFAAQMMASLSTLKSSSDKQAIVAAKEKKKQEEQAKFDDEAKMVEDLKHAKPYTPSAPIELKTAAALGLPVKELKTNRRVVDVSKRDKDVQVARYELPVAAMEFEVMDTVRNNDVTIVCGETGSGKSTQVPQFLYEAGLTLLKEQKAETPSSAENHFLIGITQPRRVAAVSTAKRVCYEMGEGDGQSIQSARKKGNLVAYQTRYETAGLGDSTHIKFMTDGILLQEIQSDLLLRKYSVVCIDEAHERNLNSDALIGLLSAAIPMRKQAAEEPGSTLVPLKLVIMSATLRVEDFTENKKLFASNPPAVLKIPGRTFPVTIHHSKVTEIENYEDVALKKICKIHRRLPQGGILVFLTGKQEIVRMVRRLRKILCRKEEADKISLAQRDTQPLDGKEAFLRDMDDEEVDGDIFADKDEGDDIVPIEDMSKSEKNKDHVVEDGSNIPDKATVLPLYSMLSTDEQAKAFAPVPEGHRLIVVATNIAETASHKPWPGWIHPATRACHAVPPPRGLCI